MRDETVERDHEDRIKGRRHLHHRLSNFTRARHGEKSTHEKPSGLHPYTRYHPTGSGAGTTERSVTDSAILDTVGPRRSAVCAFVSRTRDRLQVSTMDAQTGLDVPG